MKTLEERCIVETRGHSKSKYVRYDCGYSIEYRDGIIYVTDEETGIHTYEFYDKDFDCFYLHRILQGVFECKLFSVEQKRWFVDGLNKIEIEIPKFAFDLDGKMLRLGISKMFAKKMEAGTIKFEDLQFYRYCKDLLSLNRKYFEVDIESEIQNRLEKLQ